MFAVLKIRCNFVSTYNERELLTHKKLYIMTTATQKLIQAIKANSIVIIGKTSTAADGTKYRYDNYVLSYENAANWLVDLFSKAAVENGFKKYDKNFNTETISFFWDRPQFINTGNGKIKISELIEF